MKKFKFTVLCLLLVFGSLQIKAQNLFGTDEWPGYSCPTADLMSLNANIDPNVVQAFNDFESNLMYKVAGSSSITGTPPYTIPVVFHIVYQQGVTTPTINYSQIQWQLATLNAAFSNSLTALNNQTVSPTAIDTKISFCFAKKYKSGGSYVNWPTGDYGVMTYTTNNNSILNCDVSTSSSFTALAAMVSTSGQSYANFPKGEYLNIWLVPNMCNGGSSCFTGAAPGLIGMATFPWMTLPIDGIIMRKDAIGNNTYPAGFPMFTPLNKGLILAHEAGHYLGLFHIFETITATTYSTAGGAVSCYGTTASTKFNQGDLLGDTPPTKINSMVSGVQNTCIETYSPYGGPADENDPLENYMSYSDDDRMSAFTQEQAWRMYGSLDAAWAGTLATAASRTLLVSPTNLSNTGVTTAPSCGPGLLTALFNYSLTSATTCSSAAVQFWVPKSPYITNTTYTWAFGDGTTATYTSPVYPTHTYTTPPTVYNCTLTVSDGTNSVSYAQVITVPGAIKIVGQSGNGFPVCKGTEQTIYIEFPQYAVNATLTDGTNYYPVTCNYPVSSGTYVYPFTFSVNTSATYSLVPAACGTLNLGTATFSVVDCCSNLYFNGDFESTTLTGFYTDYAGIINGTGGMAGCASTNTIPVCIPTTNYPGMTGANGRAPTYDGCSPCTTTNTCNNPGLQVLLLGRVVSGLKPSTTYYVAYKTFQSHNAQAVGTNTANCAQPLIQGIKLANGTTTLVAQNGLAPAQVPYYAISPTTGSGKCSGLVFNWSVTTPATITPATTFSFEIYQQNNFHSAGFDYYLDDILLEEMNPAIILTPSLTSVCPGSTVQITATGNCVSLSSYTLSWNPSSSLSCSTCSNPVASPTANTVYTLVAIPPITTPPSPNLVFTTTINVVPTPTITVSSPTSACSGPYTLTALGVPTATWTPGNIVALTTTVSVPVSPTTYTAAYTAGTCTRQATVTVNPIAPATLSIAPSYTQYCVGAPGPVTLTAVSSSTATTSYTWNPGSYVGSTFTVAPASTTTYTLIADNSCGNSATVTIVSSNTCCASALPVLSTTTITGNTTITGGVVINNDITIAGNVKFINGEFLMAPNVKITVQGGNEFVLAGAHLYACRSTMWGGIQVQWDGKVTSVKSNTTGMSTLIEDATLAIDVQPITTSPSNFPMPLEISNTIFNKNMTAINVQTITLSSNVHFYLQENVFTCRNFTFTSSNWPTTSTVSPGLRTATSSTTGLTVPYSLQGAATTTILAPYAGETSSYGIKFMNVSNGITYGTWVGESGSTLDPWIFNLFDYQVWSIYAENTNLAIYNNVFQNTVQKPTRGNPIGGTAIRYVSNDNKLYRCSLTNTATISTYSVSPDVNNRFWDCHRAVEATNIYQFNMERNTIRSSHTSTAGTAFAQGFGGVYLNTNRFQYYIRFNSITNVTEPVNIPVVSGNYDLGSGVVSGIYANNLVVSNNTIAPQTSTATALGNNYVSNAIVISSPNSATWNKVANTQLLVTDNYINRVYRGISINGMNSYSTSIKTNTVNLTTDGLYGTTQRGIELVNTLNNVIITTNTLSAANTSNTLATLVYLGNNTGSTSPSVTCNYLTTSYQGFEFNSTNSNTYWRGNSMQNLGRGMVLSNVGVIGTQGSSTNASDNTWNGSWSGLNGTFVDLSSDASNSKLWVRPPTSIYFPQNNAGPSVPLSYQTATNIPTTNLGSFSCGSATGGGGAGGRLYNPEPTISPFNAAAAYKTLGSEVSEEEKFMFLSNSYRMLEFDPDLRASSDSNAAFYNALKTSNIGKLIDADKKLYIEQNSAALALKSAVSATNTVEMNNQRYIEIYSDYQNEVFDEADMTDLQYLASLCAGTNGAVVYQARALYNAITGMVFNFIEDCSSASLARSMNVKNNGAIAAWDAGLYPNPAASQINIYSTRETENLTVIIKDATGKTVAKHNLSISNFISKLDIALSNGVYFVTICTKNNESVTKKLVITN